MIQRVQHSITLDFNGIHLTENAISNSDFAQIVAAVLQAHVDDFQRPVRVENAIGQVVVGQATVCNSFVIHIKPPNEMMILFWDEGERNADNLKKASQTFTT